ncbi:MAG: Rrf2 family transcriptional regulator, partial [Candidatus Roizmanbacteria bacterium]|nr:Rrf2 family transcriptional regulator [Candidatus Roizmanbacteria bacterium]
FFFVKLLLTKYMLAITKQSDYGLILVSYIYKKEGLVKLSDLIKATQLPQRFLARIAAELVKNGLLISKEGKNGGYLISSKIKTFSLYDYLLIFENDVVVSSCVDKNYDCKYESVCNHKDFIKKRLNVVLTKELKKIRLLQLID